MEAGSASKGQEPSVFIIRNGDDPSGNPKYKIDLVLPQGDAGKNPVLELGEVMTVSQAQRLLPSLFRSDKPQKVIRNTL